MKDLTPKINNSTTAAGELTAEEFNDMRNDAQNSVTESGQVLTVAVGDDNRQLLKAIAVGGGRVSRANAETAQVGEIVLADNSAAILTVNLPLVADVFVNATVEFEQVIDQPYSAFALTVGRNSQLIMGLAEDFIFNSLNADDSKVKFSWAGGSIGWSVALVATTACTL